MTGIARMATGWRDGLLDYIIEGTRQFEWCSAVMSVLIGGSSLLLFFPADVLGRFSYPMAGFIATVNLLMFLLGLLSAQSLITDNRQRRYDVSRWMAMTWLFKGSVWVKAQYGNSYIWVTLVLVALFFFFICTVAFYHNSLALKEERDGSP